MKGLYIHDIDFVLRPEYRGVSKKIDAQINAFKSLSVDMDLIHVENNNIKIADKEVGINIGKYKFGRIKNTFFFSNICKLLKNNKIINLNRYDFVYIRFSMANIGMYYLIKFLFKSNLKVILEVPTFPYKDELSNNFINFILKNIDDMIWRKLYKYVYRIAVTNDLRKLYGVNTVSIYNGVDLDSIKVSKNISDNEIINVTGIANISKWHGYDRLIKGLSNYYSSNNSIKQKIHFNIVGEGEEKANLENLSKELMVTDYVHFLGYRSGEDLDTVMDGTNIGISSLALFRAGGGHDPIKSKEFIARGLPVVLGYNDKLIDMSLSYVIKVPENDEAIDVGYIIDRYKRINVSNSEVRLYAEKNLSWRSQIAKVISSINEC